jgi:hypothetical protein
MTRDQRFKALKGLLSSSDVFFFCGDDAAGCSLEDFSINKAISFHGLGGQMNWVIEESDEEALMDIRSEGLEERPAILIVGEP